MNMLRQPERTPRSSSFLAGGLLSTMALAACSENSVSGTYSDPPEPRRACSVRAVMDDGEVVIQGLRLRKRPGHITDITYRLHGAAGDTFSHTQNPSDEVRLQAHSLSSDADYTVYATITVSGQQQDQVVCTPELLRYDAP